MTVATADGAAPAAASRPAQQPPQQQQAPTSADAIKLEWVFGLNKDFRGAVHNLSDVNDASRRIFYTVAHNGIVYDATTHTQRLLQGHRNSIVASCVSANRRFIVTADVGDESLLIVWDVHTCLPVQSMKTDTRGGVQACAISPDSTKIVTLSKNQPQTIALWAWTTTGDPNVPELVETVSAKDEQTCVQFSPDDATLVVTNGTRRVLFWSFAEGSWKFYSPAVASKEVKQVIGSFTQSSFVSGTSVAVTGTVDGDVVLWGKAQSDKVTKETDRVLLKVVRAHTGGVSCVTGIGPYIVTGGVEGYVRFLDHKLRIVAWFEELNGGPILSVSFDRPTPEFFGPQALAAQTAKGGDGEPYTGDQFRCPDFVVSTANAMIIDVPSRAFVSADTEAQRGRLLVQGQDQPIVCIAAHPSLPRLAIAGYSGNLHLWEYTTHKVLLLSIFRNLLVQCLAFDPKAMYLGVGFTNGIVKVLDANSLEELQNFKPKKSADSITRITFSHNSQFFATADTEGSVALYRFTNRAQHPKKRVEWVDIGRYRTHRAAITGLQFGVVPYGDAPRLMSLGEDKRLVEYNLVDSSIEGGLKWRSAIRMSQGAIPTGFLWTTDPLLDDSAMPRGAATAANINNGSIVGADDAALAGSGDGTAASTSGGLLSGIAGPAVTDVILLATNEFKLKVHATDTTRQCLKTVLGPTYGGPLCNILAVPAQAGSRTRVLVFSCHERVVGMIQLPLEGNPRDAIALVAHPGEVAAMCVSHDGKHLFTAGGRDCAVHQWRLHPEAAVVQGGGKLSHFIEVIEGGPTGAFMKEIIDYFFYAQIRAQGEETTAKRRIENTIPFGQVSSLMRALGFYLSEKDIANMTFEVKTRAGAANVAVDDIQIDFEAFIRLYVNHRPVFGITKRNIEEAFSAVGADPVTGIVDRQQLFNVLQQRGEAIHPYDIDKFLKGLLGDDVSLDMLEDKITAKAFAENLLGFEDYEDEGVASGAAAGAAAAASTVG